MNPRYKVLLLVACTAVGNASCATRVPPEIVATFSSAVQDTTAPLSGWRDDGTVVDVLVVYTRRAEADFAADGRDIAESIRRAAAQADSAFRNSGIDLRVNVVHFERVDFKEKTGWFGKGDLDRLQGSQGAAIREMRRRYRADVVTLIRQDGGKNVAMNLESIATTPHNLAIAYANAYSVINSSCVDESYRCFVHELGHLLGAGHNAEKKAPGLFPDSYGYHHPGQITDQTPCVFGTMQDYECADTLRILHFSNPGISYQGHPTGVAGKADNARAINASRRFVANHEQSSLRGM